MFAKFIIATLAITAFGPLYNEKGSEVIVKKSPVEVVKHIWETRDKEAHKDSARYND